MKRLTALTLLTLLTLFGCKSNEKWKTFDYSNPEQVFAAEQLIKIPDDDKFEDFFKCKVWATKRTFGIVLPITRQEYFEGYIAIPDGFDVYVFVYDIKGDYQNGDCKLIDFNDTAYEEFKEYEHFKGHYRIDKIKIYIRNK